MTDAKEIDALAQEIRSVEGWRDLGAGALATELAPLIAQRYPPAVIHDPDGITIKYGKATLGTAEHDVDGFYYFYPGDAVMGHWDATVLRHIAAELDRLNATWTAQIERELGR